MNRNLSHLVEKVCHHWETRRQAAAAQKDPVLSIPHSFTISISREAGTQGTLIAKEVGKLLNWQVYDYQLLEHIAQDMGLRTSLLQSVDERRRSWLTETADTFMSLSPVTESSYVHHLVKRILALGVHGECVIVGRGATFILPADTTLRVRLIGSLRDRITTLSRVLEISAREAASQVRTIERERNDFVQSHFHKDLTDPANYDIVLNVSRLSVTQCGELIVEALLRLMKREAREKHPAAKVPVEGVGAY